MAARHTLRAPPGYYVSSFELTAHLTQCHPPCDRVPEPAARRRPGEESAGDGGTTGSTHEEALMVNSSALRTTSAEDDGWGLVG
ncbi:hypothetical protein GCM10010276_64030 [Streptomyces longisporus]|uniref:Uncharacterized protein n=1 Tax=Streptomyces longisporus TaxID=1948 RepID=A0ABN3MUX6_STRLO